MRHLINKHPAIMAILITALGFWFMAYSIHKSNMKTCLAEIRSLKNYTPAMDEAELCEFILEHEAEVKDVIYSR